MPTLAVTEMFAPWLKSEPREWVEVGPAYVCKGREIEPTVNVSNSGRNTWKEVMCAKRDAQLGRGPGEHAVISIIISY